MKYFFYILAMAFAIFVSAVTFNQLNKVNERNFKEITRFPISDNRYIVPFEYRQDVFDSAAFYGVPLDIAIRLGFEESGWDENAIRINGNGSVDRGLYQLNSRYHKKMSTEKHIKTAIKHVAYCYKKTGSWKMAIVAYNCGVYRSKNSPPKRSLILAEKVVSS